MAAFRDGLAGALSLGSLPQITLKLVQFYLLCPGILQLRDLGRSLLNAAHPRLGPIEWAQMRLDSVGCLAHQLQYYRRAMFR